jgi:hypothetical protein
MTPEKKEPRVWWICQSKGFDGDAYDTDPETWTNPPKYGQRPATKVIEHSAYRELEEANKRLRELLHSALYGSFFSDTSRREVIGKELDKLLNPTMEK